MNDDELWAAIDAQRVRTVALLQELTGDEWDRTSLCDGWRVRDVVAHLAMQPVTFGAAIKALARHPGSLNQLSKAAAIREADRRPPQQLIARIAGLVGSHRPNVAVTVHEALIEIIVHGHDIAIPLERRLDVPAEAAATAASRVWAGQATRRGRLMARVFRPLPYQRYRLIATDTAWAVGEGPEIHGPILAILLLLTGRTARYADLTGPGAVELGAALELT